MLEISTSASQPLRITVLAGGVGGARLAHGLNQTQHHITVIINTGDDTTLHGLRICPDIDTVTYTLAGIINEQQGWGLTQETYHALKAMGSLGENTWFQLGDKDLGTHIVRTHRLQTGDSLSQITADFSRSLGIHAHLIPMTDDLVATMVNTPTGVLSFQEYFVQRRHRDPVLGLNYHGAELAQPAPGVIDAIMKADYVLIAPSNPLLSIAPILAVPNIRDALTHTTARRIAVSPLINGRAIKGPAADILAAQGHEVSALGVARMYHELIDAMCFDLSDRHLSKNIAALGIDTIVTDTLIQDAQARERLARELIS